MQHRILHLLMLTTVAVACAASCTSEIAAPGDCGGTVCDDEEPAEPPRFFVDPPFGLGFDCVTIGCDNERRLVVENRGGGTVRLVLTRLSVGTSTDFTLRRADGVLPVDDATAFDVVPGTPLELFVRYVPSDGSADSGAVVFNWHDGKAAFADAVLTTVEVPLSSRALGDVAAVIDTPRLNFGFVPVGGYATRQLTVANTGTAGVLSMGPVSLEEGTAAVFQPSVPTSWDEQFVNPNAQGVINVDFRPDSVGTFTGAVFVQTNDAAQPAIRVEVAGTAVSSPDAVALTPAIDFLALRLGSARTLPLTVENRGGSPLTLSPSISGAGFAVDTTPVVVAPLERATFQVVWTPPVGGAASGQVVFATNDPAEPTLTVGLSGFCDAPLIAVAPVSIDFGSVVIGWQTGAQSFSISNAGFGDLTINSIAFDVGSSTQIRFVDVPPLPVKLQPGDPPLVVSLAMEASTLGTVLATVLVGSDSIDGALGNGGVARLQAGGVVVTCEQGCPVQNGQPSCGSGSCQVGACDSRFHDSNNAFGDGCECGEDLVPGGGGTRRDISGTCDTVTNIGPLGDDCADVTEVRRSGTLHDETDVDLYFFHATDDFEFFGCDFGSDSFGVLLRLENAPAGARVCARQASSGCGGEDQRRCGGTELFFNGGNQVFGGSDTTDFTAWVEWEPGAAPQCGNYTLFVKGNGG
jgi:hypothetical protein